MSRMRDEKPVRWRWSVRAGAWQVRLPSKAWLSVWTGQDFDFDATEAAALDPRTGAVFEVPLQPSPWRLSRDATGSWLVSATKGGAPLPLTAAMRRSTTTDAVCMAAVSPAQLAATRAHSKGHLGLLRLASCGTVGLDLLRSNPLLAHGLAHLPVTRSELMVLAAGSRRDILRRLGLPATRGWSRLLATAPAALASTALIAALRALAGRHGHQCALLRAGRLNRHIVQAVIRSPAHLGSGIYQTLAALDDAQARVARPLRKLRRALDGFEGDFARVLSHGSGPRDRALPHTVETRRDIASASLFLQVTNSGGSGRPAAKALAGMAPEWATHIRFPPPPLQGSNGVRHLDTGLALHKHANQQRNCIADSLWEARAGRVAFYAVQAPDGTGTLMLREREPGHWFAQAAGARNTPASDRFMHTVTRWLRGVSLATPFDSTPPQIDFRHVPIDDDIPF